MTVMAAEAAGNAVTAREAAKKYARDKAGEKARQAPGYARKRGKMGTPGGGGYQTAILAEFLVAAGVVAFMPLATGGPEDKNSPSPYTVNDLTQLAAIGVTYFILAVVPGKWARWSAWLGLLILLGIMYRKMATGELNAAITGIHPGSHPTDETL